MTSDYVWTWYNPNEAVIIEIIRTLPTVDEVLQDLNQSTVSRLDVKWAFHQIELKEESRSITTFVTYQGLYHYKRLMFGISCAPEVIPESYSKFCKAVKEKKTFMMILLSMDLQEKSTISV